MDQSRIELSRAQSQSFQLSTNTNDLDCGLDVGRPNSAHFDRVETRQEPDGFHDVALVSRRQEILRLLLRIECDIFVQ